MGGAEPDWVQARMVALPAHRLDPPYSILYRKKYILYKKSFRENVTENIYRLFSLPFLFFFAYDRNRPVFRSIQAGWYHDNGIGMECVCKSRYTTGIRKGQHYHQRHRQLVRSCCWKTLFRADLSCEIRLQKIITGIAADRQPEELVSAKVQATVCFAG